jgi:hypothetical protein
MEAHITKIFSAIKPFVRIVELDNGWKDVRKYLEDELARIHRLSPAAAKILSSIL